ncbi:MAG: FAD-dependent oxidoreductase [Rhizomicrobium sp.]
MVSDQGSILVTRREQAFPILTPQEIDRLRHFGETRRYKPGEYLAKAGERAPGMLVVQSGEVDASQHNALGHDEHIITHAPGSFSAELSSLSGAPALVNAVAKTEVEALVIPPERLRALMVEEAELGERIMRALILRRMGLIETGHSGPVIVGNREDSNVLRLADFLHRNGHPHQILDAAKEEAAKVLLERFDGPATDLPLVFCPAGQVLRNPSEDELAKCLGLIDPIDPAKLYDVAIVGAGPAGLATAVYAASEGLEVLVLDCRAFGGQAGASARIENYLGFPTGITGMALMGRAYNQAQKFGAHISIPDEAVALREADGHFLLDTSDGDHAQARAVVIATGARYRRLNLPDLDQYEGSHVHYWASALEAKLCTGEEVALVGAGNSAAQGAVFLASRAKKVWLLMRGKDLRKTMSEYLVERISAQENIEVLAETEISALDGHDGKLERVRWRNKSSETETERPIRHVFLFCGADPNTDWLKTSGIGVDGKRFVRTGLDLGKDHPPLHTSMRGVFAIGDVRSGSVKRVAASVGEGAQVVAAIHAYLAELD